MKATPNISTHTKFKKYPAGNSKVITKYFFNKLQQNQVIPQPAFTCLKLKIETLEQGVKYVQS